MSKSYTSHPTVLTTAQLTTVFRIARVAGQQILASNGVIRGMKNWGQFDLPRPTTKHQTQHRQGHYFVMQFDASVQAQQDVRRFLSLDPRMIRFSVVKIGDKLGGVNGAIEEADGQMPWNEGKTEYIFQNPRVAGRTF